MYKEINLHIGCGTVYLNGWTNVDFNGISPTKFPQQYNDNSTDISHYYKYPFTVSNLEAGKPKREVVLDLMANATHLPLVSNSVDRILTVNLINHLRFQDFLPMVKDWHRILKPHGELIIDVDDVVGMCANVVESSKKGKAELEKALRYLHCHSRTQFDSHLWGYTPEYLKELLEPIGFEFVWRDDEYIHHDADYPRFLMAFRKNQECLEN